MILVKELTKTFGDFKAFAAVAIGLIVGLASGEVLDNLVLYRGKVKKSDKVKTSVYIVKNTIIEEDMIKGALRYV